MNIAIASGKGGTGKTLVATNLARCAMSAEVLLDCDVEEPNDRLFLQSLVPCGSQDVHVDIPLVDGQRCNGCGACIKSCRFNALAMLAGHVVVFDELCHSCGACAYACAHGAIKWQKRHIGTIRSWETLRCVLHEGCLDVGVSMAVPLIRAVKRVEVPDGVLVLLDSPPGTSCPMVWTAVGCDGVLLVTEPTPFGYHDLELAVDTIREVGLPIAVVVNKDGLGTDAVDRLCETNAIPIIARIPYDPFIARSYARGHLIVDESDTYRSLFERLWKDLFQTFKEEPHA